MIQPLLQSHQRKKLMPAKLRETSPMFLALMLLPQHQLLPTTKWANKDGSSPAFLVNLTNLHQSHPLSLNRGSRMWSTLIKRHGKSHKFLRSQQDSLNPRHCKGREVILSLERVQALRRKPTLPSRFTLRQVECLTSLLDKKYILNCSTQNWFLTSLLVEGLQAYPPCVKV